MTQITQMGEGMRIAPYAAICVICVICGPIHLRHPSQQEIASSAISTGMPPRMG